MANIFKRTISFVLAMLMVMSLLPGVGHVHAHAEEGEQETTAVTVPVEETTAPAVEETVTQETVGELSPLDNIVDVQSAGAIMPLATTKNFADSTVADLGISATDASGNGGPVCSWNASATNITGSLVGGKDSSGARKFYYESTTTLTLTNNKTSEAELSFKYTATTSGSGYGDITVNGTKHTSSVTDKEVSVTLAAGAYITIVLHVPQRVKLLSMPEPNGASITISDIKLVSQGSVTVNFAAAENGSYTVTNASGAAVSVPGSVSAKSTDRFTMTATPAAGYAFAGWYNVTTGDYLSADLSYTTLFAENATVKPLFALAADGVYGVGDTVFTDLTDAATAAAFSSNKTVVLLKNATLTGSHTIPAGVVLLIPYDAAHTLNTADPESVTVDHSKTSSSNYVKYEKPSAFRTLTMASGASITVNGAISVNAMHESCVGGQIYGGQVLGKYGCIKMTSGSSITLNNGANLYAWGYIWGDGTVTAKSGATVYEKMQVTDYRGGSNTSVIALRNGFGKTDGAFPFNQYYIQNVEVKEVLHEGATLMAHAAVNLSGETPVEAAVEFIGTTSAMFTVSGATITKEYHPETDRLSLTVDGDENSYMEMNGMKLAMGTLSIDSANYTLPINGNIDITINAGTAIVNQELVLQPGVKLTVGEAAMLGTNTNIYIMDNDQWGAFVFSAKRQQAVVYTPSLGGPSKRTINSDAVIDINGYVVPIGGVFTTAGGAQIISSEKTGLIEFAADAPGDSTVAQLTGGSDVKNINVTAAQLTNGNANKPFTATKGAAAGDLFFYCPECDSWHRETDECAPTTLPAVEITWIGANGANLGTQEFEMNTVPVYNGTPTKAQSGCTTYTFAGWSTEANGGGTKYAVGTALPAATADATYYAYFTEGTSHTKVVTDAKVAATCTTDGKTEGSHCEACGTVIVAQTTISATGHDMQKTADQVDATCEKDGKTAIYTCANNCGKTEGGAVIPATKHNMQQSAAKVDATCEKDGKEAVYTCANNCGKTEGGAVIPATGHDMQKTADQVDATCEGDGKTAIFTCANNCGKTEGGAVIPATGHDMQKTADQVDATCEADGKTAVYTCANNCGKTEGGAVIPATGHTNGAPVTENKVEADCDDDGSYDTVVYCSVCGEELSRKTTVVPATGHTSGASSIENKVDATCEDKGGYDEVTYCLICGVETSRNHVVTSAKGHTAGESVKENEVAATCGADGSYDTVIYCSVCGEELSRETTTVPATGAHVYATETERVEATCTVDGYVIMACGCGATEKTTLSAPGHTAGEAVEENKVPADCENDGSYDTVVYCSVCGEELSRVTSTIPATGHTNGAPVTENKVEADCENDGSYDTVVYCSVCGEELSRVTSTIPALGHSEPVYTNNGDTHSVDYPCCDGLDVLSESHTYENGQCICGAKEPFTVGVVNDYGVADTIALSNPIAIPGQDYVTTISGTVGTSFGIWGVYNGAGEWIDPYFCCIFDGETNTLTVRGEYVDEGMVLEIGAWVTATYYLNGGYVNSRYDTSFVPDANGAFTWEWNCGYYPFSFWSFDIGGIILDGNYAFEREGYTLVGYNTAADGSGTMYGFEQKVAHTEDIVLYMIWECNHDTWQDATCTAPKTCTTCGKTEGEALGHSEPVYTNNGDTHSAVYPCCGEAYVTDEPHDFENEDHKCVCGMVEMVDYTVEVYYMDTEGNYPETPGKTMTFTVPYGTKVNHYDDVQTPGFVISGNLPQAIITESFVMKVQMCRAAIQIQYRDEQDNILGRQLIYFEVTDTLRTDEEVAPARTGYTFVGWATEIGGDVVYGLDNLEYTNTSTYFVAVEVLYPVYELSTYTVTFTVLGQVYDTVTVTYGEKIALPETDPEVEGYRFNGWKNVPNSMPDNDLTIEADLVEQVTISYYRYNCDAYQYEYDYDVTVDKGTEVELPYYYWNYSNTLGWDANDDGVVDYEYNETINANESLTLKPVLVPFYADVDLGAEDAVFVDAEGNPITRIYAENAYINYIYLTNHPTREGYTFLGWLVNGSEQLVYTNDESGELEVFLNFGDNYSATALWEINTHTVTWTVNGEYYDETMFEYGQSVTAPEFEIPAGHSFSGWTVPDTMPDADITLDATLTANTHTVTFTVNGEYYAEVEVKYGQSITAPEFVIPEGHTFSGWTVPGTMPDTDITLDATLTVNTYTVTFTVNGEYYADAQVKYGQSVTAPEFEIPEGHTFSGWTVSDTMPAEDITLDAALTVNTYTVTFTVNGEYYADAQVKYGQSVTAPEYVIPEGHSFSGWTVPDTMPAKDITLDAALTVNVYELSIFVGDHVDENGVCYTAISLQVPYGALLKDYLVETPDFIANTDDRQGKYTFAYWHTYASNVALDTETATMPANYIRYYATYDYTGWYIEEGGKYFVDHYEPIAGWFCVNDKNELVTDGSGDWYYTDPYKDYTNTGVSRAPYPAEAINGITYAPDQESMDYGKTHYGYFIDEEEAWFVFDEDGKFQYAETGMVTYQGETRYAVNGMLPWHVGLVQIGEDYYYFIGDTEIGGNIMATGNVYMSRNNTDLDVVTSGVYTYGADGKLLKADGITDVNGTLYYYEDYQLMIGAGLIKIDEDYYYVRSNGALVVDCEYWVGDNKFGIVEGTYQFDENGKLVLPVYEYRNGVYAEDGGLFYYVNGNRTYAGLIEWNGGWIYVRSNGQLAVGRYWTTKHNDVKPEGFYDFDENGMLIEQKNGIINENGTLYYYINNEKQYNSGVIQLNGNYYYVRSNGVVVADQNYWITNVGTSGVVAKQYTFDANGVMQNPEFAVNVKEGVVDGYYYENGKIVYGAGLIEWNGDYYYVRSNGQVATGEYWITTTNGLKPQGKYNFGTDGKMILN